METLFVLWIKWRGMVEIKHEGFIGAVLIIPAMWIMAWGSIDKGKPRFPWVHWLWWVLWQGSRIARLYTGIKIANNKSNHIMVSFTDHYNVISIDRLTSKTKIGKSSWCLNIFFYANLISTPLQFRFKENAKILSKKQILLKNTKK